MGEDTMREDMEKPSQIHEEDTPSTWPFAPSLPLPPFIPIFHPTVFYDFSYYFARIWALREEGKWNCPF
jgi:hypothetical protein